MDWDAMVLGSLHGLGLADRRNGALLNASAIGPGYTFAPPVLVSQAIYSDSGQQMTT